MANVLRGGQAALRRWGPLLKPWRAHFKQMEDILSADTVVQVDLGVDASTKHSWRENVALCRETLELLALVAFVETKKHRETPRRFVINCYNRESIQSVPDIDVFAAFFFASDGDASALSDEFYTARQEIFRRIAPEMRRQVVARWQVPVQFFMSTTRHGPFLSSAYLASALELVKGIGARAKQATAQATALVDGDITAAMQWGYRFPYADTLARLVIARCSMEPTAAPLLAELIALGVQIKEAIQLGSASVLGGLSVSSLGPVLQAITDGEAFRASEGYEKLLCDDAWEVLTLENWAPATECHARLLKAVCSSLAVCKDFKGLQLSRFGVGCSREYRLKVLQWLAYALFSIESATTITSLTLNDMVLENEDMVGLIDVLVAKSPVRELLDDSKVGDADVAIGEPDSEDNVFGDDESGDASKDSGFAVVKAGATISIAPVDGESELNWLVLAHDNRFRVMQNDENCAMVDVVVPHYGHCVVPRASVDLFEPAAAAPAATTDVASTGYAGLITSLTLTNSSFKVLLPLIDYIGPKLLSLDVRGDVDAEFLSRALAACPNLTKLAVVKPTEDMENALVEAYESGGCNVSWLRLTGYPRDHEEWTATEAFIRMLENPASRASKIVRHLEMRACKCNFLDEDVYEALAEMLQVNRTIEFFRTSVCDYGDGKIEALSQTNGVQVAPHPLVVASRYAFFGVLWRYFGGGGATGELSQPPPTKKRHRNADTTSFVNQERLDRGITTSIFTFAAARAVRRVQIDSVGDEN